MKQNILYHGFGFPVFLKGVEFKGEGDDRYLDIRHEDLAADIFEAVLEKPAPWTGAELRFVRKHMDMTQVEFATFAHVKTHSSIVGWEKKNMSPTGISEPAELFIRMKILHDKFSPQKATSFLNEFGRKDFQEGEDQPLQIQVGEAA